MTLGFPDVDPNGLPGGRRTGNVGRGILLLIVVIVAVLVVAGVSGGR